MKRCACAGVGAKEHDDKEVSFTDAFESWHSCHHGPTLTWPRATIATFVAALMALSDSVMRSGGGLGESVIGSTQ